MADAVPPLRWRPVNADYTPGGDRRLPGVVGKLLGGAQRAGMAYSAEPPRVAKLPLGAGHVAVALSRGTAVPLPIFSLFVPRGDGRFWSLRFPYRYDANVGDGKNPHEPAHDPPGAYFPEFILKTDIDNVVEP